jgi:hypothetical protein
LKAKTQPLRVEKNPGEAAGCWQHGLVRRNLNGKRSKKRKYNRTYTILISRPNHIADSRVRQACDMLLIEV